MTTVRMRAQLRGAIDGREPPAPGELFEDLPAEEAQRMLACGQAVMPDEPLGPADRSPQATLWAGTSRLVLPGDSESAGTVRTDGRALTGRANLRRETV